MPGGLAGFQLCGIYLGEGSEQALRWIGMDGEPRRVRVAQTGIVLVILAVTFALVTPAIRHSLFQLLETLGGRAETPAPRPTSVTDLAAFRDRFAHPAVSGNDHASDQPYASRAGAAGTAQRALSLPRGPRTTSARGRVGTNGGSAPADKGESRGDSESSDESNLSAAADRSSATTVPPAEAIGDVSPRSTLLAPPPTPAPATSQSSAATAVSVRQGAFKVMASEVQSLIAALDAAPPDVSTVHAKALHLEQLGTMIPDLFAFDTHAFMTNTTALPKIWQEESQFDAKANKFVAAMQALVSVSSTADAAGDSNLTLRQTAARALAICGECHVVYGQPGTPGTVRPN